MDGHAAVTAPGDDSFHAGECAVQERTGVRARLAAVGHQVMRSFMPEQHRDFFAQLPFVVAGTVDAQGQPWASVLAHPPGFVSSPNPRQLDIRARPLHADPLNITLAPGAPIGLLGIEPHTRRRNRMNGTVSAVTDAGFSVRVNQSFGNCPKYIQAREPHYIADAATQHEVRRATVLDENAKQSIRRADTFFIATAYPAAETDHAPSHGVDVSHRGGNPGFVRVDADDTLTVPDFLGNFFFNTLGNLQVNPRAGLLFIDFASGGLLYLAVDAAIIWDGPELRTFKGAQRLMRFHVREMLHVETSLPLRWGAAHLSPHLASTGTWPSA